MALVAPMLVLRARQFPRPAIYCVQSLQTSRAALPARQESLHEPALESMSQPRSILKRGAEPFTLPCAGILPAYVGWQERARQGGVGRVGVPHVSRRQTAAVEARGMSGPGVPPAVAPLGQAVDAARV